MKFFSLPAILLSLVVLSQPAYACRYLVDVAAKMALSDIVVDGTAVCSPKERVCRVKVTRFIKGKSVVKGSGIVVSVEYPSEQKDPNTIILRCSSSWEPSKETVTGRFYFSKKSDGTIVAPIHPEIESD